MFLLMTAALAHATDTDLDSVPDTDDLCSFQDDTVDLDANGVPDCDETILGEFGFSDTATLIAYKDHSTSSLVWDPDDLNGYTHSGSGMVSNGLPSARIQVVRCVQVVPGAEYAVMGQFSSTADGSFHYLLLNEFLDANCKTPAPSTFLGAYGWGVFGDRFDPVDTLPLVGTYQVPSHVRAVKLSATADAYQYWAARAWFDDLSMHPIGDVPTLPSGDPKTE